MKLAPSIEPLKEFKNLPKLNLRIFEGEVDLRQTVMREVKYNLCIQTHDALKELDQQHQEELEKQREIERQDLVEQKQTRLLEEE